MIRRLCFATPGELGEALARDIADRLEASSGTFLLGCPGGRSPRALPEGQQEVLLLRFVDDLSLREVAAALGIPVGPVKSRLHQAIATLREDPRTRALFDLEESG